MPDIQKVIKKHFYLLQSSPEVKEIFPAKSIFPAYRRTKNLKEMLAPPKFRVTSSGNQGEENTGYSKCYLIQASKFQSSATGRQYSIQQELSCSSQNVIYLATCANATCNMLAPPRLNLKYDFVITSPTCLRTKEFVSWPSILMTLNMKFLKTV